DCSCNELCGVEHSRTAFPWRDSATRVWAACPDRRDPAAPGPFARLARAGIGLWKRALASLPRRAWRARTLGCRPVTSADRLRRRDTLFVRAEGYLGIQYASNPSRRSERSGAVPTAASIGCVGNELECKTCLSVPESLF